MAEDDEEQAGGQKKKDDVPFFVWPWYICTKPDCWPYAKGAFMCLAMFVTAAGIEMCEPYPIWCLGSAGVALICSVLAQREIYMSGNLKRIHHGLQNKNKCICKDSDVLQWSMGKNKECVQTVHDCHRNLEIQVEKLENIASLQEISRLQFGTKVESLMMQREAIMNNFQGFKSVIRELHGSDEKLEDELDAFTDLINEVQDVEKEMTEDLQLLSNSHQHLEDSKDRLQDELEAFYKMREIIENSGVKWTRDIVEMTESMKQKYKDLFQLCMTFSVNFLKEIVHNCEYMDGKPGFTLNKFQELMKRLPNNVRAKANFRLISRIFKDELRKAASSKEAKLLGYKAVHFEVFQEEIVRNCLLPLCDVFTSGADDVVVDDEMESISGEKKSAEVEL